MAPRAEGEGGCRPCERPRHQQHRTTAPQVCTAIETPSCCTSCGTCKIASCTPALLNTDCWARLSLLARTNLASTRCEFVCEFVFRKRLYILEGFYNTSQALIISSNRAVSHPHTPLTGQPIRQPPCMATTAYSGVPHTLKGALSQRKGHSAEASYDHGCSRNQHFGKPHLA